MEVETGYSLDELEKEEFLARLKVRCAELSEVFIKRLQGYQGVEGRIAEEMKLGRIQNVCCHSSGYILWRDAACIGCMKKSCVLCGYTSELEQETLLRGTYLFASKKELELILFEICKESERAYVDNNEDYLHIAYKVLKKFLFP